MQLQDTAVYFVSDAHLGSEPDPDGRSRSLASFLESLGSRASNIYLLGDLFDFWFEYRHAVPKGHFRVLHAIAGLVDAGIQVDYLGGNHDFWAGDYLAREVGVTVHQHPLRVTHQGRKIYLAHGDGLGRGDTGYRMLKGLLRNRLAIALYKSLHPDLGIPFAYRVSRISRKHAKPREEILRNFSRYVVSPCYEHGDDAVIVGHVHDPVHLRDARGRDFVIAGDWIESMTWARLEEGRIILERLAGNKVEQIPAEAWPDSIGPDSVGPDSIGQD